MFLKVRSVMRIDFNVYKLDTDKDDVVQLREKYYV